MADQVTYISTRGALRRLVLLIPLALALTGVWFSARWYLGDTIAENLDPDNRSLETARLAAGLAPRDPLPHWRMAEIMLRTLPPEQISQAIAEYELATILSPNDYRFWLSLGRALEQSGDAEKGERAMRRAVELAPAYAYPRWYLGNLLLRSGQEQAAFVELRRASEAYDELRPQVFNLAWQLYHQSPNELTSAIGPAVPARAEFARYLIDSGQLDEGLRFWNSLNASEKKESQVTGQAMMKSLSEGKRFRHVLALWNDLAPAGAQRPEVAQIMDGGCEQDAGSDNGPFGWQVKSTKQAQVTFDTVNHYQGARSLRIVFQAAGKVEFNVSQLVTIEPGTEYDLDCFLRTYQLASAGSPVVEVIDAADGAVLGASTPAPADNNNWQPITTTFKTGPKAEAIVIRISRASCGTNTVCPIFGSVWYDNFSLKRRG